MFHSRLLPLLLVFGASCAWADEPVFSGPQVGELMPSFKAVGLHGDLIEKEFDFIADAEGAPVMLVFFHELTRPGFGLTRAISQFAATQHVDGEAKEMKVGVIFLSDDASETKSWALKVARLFSKDVIYGVSTDGKEGPGVYGLNRNVKLTILIGKDGKVSENMALVQPQLQVDGPKLLSAICAATGNPNTPKVEQLAGNQMRGRDDTQARDPKLGALVRQMIQKDLSADQVSDLAKKIESYVTENEQARTQLAQMSSKIVGSGNLKNYGTEDAQKTIMKWAKQYGPKMSKVE